MVSMRDSAGMGTARLNAAVNADNLTGHQSSSLTFQEKLQLMGETYSQV